MLWLVYTLTNEASTQSTPHEKHQIKKGIISTTKTHTYIFRGVRCMAALRHLMSSHAKMKQKIHKYCAMLLFLCLVLTLIKYFHSIKAIEGWIEREERVKKPPPTIMAWSMQCVASLKKQQQTAKLFKIHCINESMKIFCVSANMCAKMQINKVNNGFALLQSRVQKKLHELLKQKSRPVSFVCAFLCYCSWNFHLFHVWYVCVRGWGRFSLKTCLLFNQQTQKFSY